MAKHWLDEKLYPGIEDRWDDKLFREIILKYLDFDSILLDLGAGSGIIPEMNFKDIAKKVYGIDPDKSVKNNPYLHEVIVGMGEELPYEDKSFEIVISDNVLEHLADPKKVFKEVYRTLKPGGYYLFKTPNKYHYMPMISRLTPHFFHVWVNKKRGRNEEDTFPTTYLANSLGDIEKIAKESKFIVEEIEFYEGRPEYLRFSTPTYITGWIYERLVNRIRSFKKNRILLIGILKKPN